LRDAVSFSRTKIQPPRRRPATLARPALEAWLDRALLVCRLVLPSTPGGRNR
jgi:ATP/maltotriose-dependent transcriptional regulator MalT